MFRHALAFLFILGLSSHSFANYVGSESQYFNVNPGNMDFFTVHSSRTLPKGAMKTTLFFDYAGNIHYSNPNLKNNVLQTQLGFAVGINDKVSFSLAGTGILNYNDKEGGEYTDDNITYVRANVKYKWCDCAEGGLATIVSLGYGLNDPDYFVGDEDNYGVAVLMAYDKLITERVRFGANLGYRYGSSGDPLTGSDVPGNYPLLAEARQGSDVLASVGMNVILNDKLTGVSEVYATLPTDELFDFRTEAGNLDEKGAEVLLGANYRAGNGLDIGFGGTVGVFSLAKNADWRLFAGIGYVFGGDTDKAEFNMMGSDSAPAPKKAKASAAKKIQKIENAPVLKEFDITAKFASGSSNLSAEAKSQISEVGAFLKGKDFRMVFVEGHTDSAGAESFNQQLSERRAQMIKNYMMRTYDIPDTKIQSIGYGETSPIADNSTPVGRAKNRRVTIKVK